MQKNKISSSFHQVIVFLRSRTRARFKRVWRRGADFVKMRPLPPFQPVYVKAVREQLLRRR